MTTGGMEGAKVQQSLPQTCSRADKKLTLHRDGETDQTLLKLLLPMLMLMV